MRDGPTTGASETETRTWSNRPVLAAAVRAALFVVPIVGGWLAVRITAPHYWQPETFGIVAWIAQAIVVATLAAKLVSRATDRFLPLSTILGMTLVFPDHAPSRFGTALRAGNLNKLMGEQALTAGDTQRAAEEAVAMVAALGRHERLTRGHTERVRAYADLIGQEMGLGDDELLKLRWGVLLHDVGKLSVPAEILNKQGRPTAEEWAILKRHPSEGARMITPLADWLGEWSLATAQHHERWDGEGYPCGLAGTDISLAGRIAAVADAYDVITSKRSYKEPMSPEAARAELVSCAGAQFDPDVVRAMLRVGLTKRRSLGALSWIMEVPTVARVASQAANAPAAVAATAAVAVSTVIAPAAVAVPVEDVAPPPAIERVAPDVDPTPTVLPAPAETTTSTTTVPLDVPEGEVVTVTTTTPATTTTLEDATVTTTTLGDPRTSTSTPIPTSTTEPPSGAAPPPPTTTAAPAARRGTTTTTTVPPTTPTTTTTTTSPTTTTTAAPEPGPTASPDYITGQQGQKIKIDVLDNDVPGPVPIDEDTLEVINIPSHTDTVEVHNDHIDLWSDPDHEGNITVVYRICDTDGSCDTSQAFVTITN